MSRMNEIMIDLETLSLSNRARILSIGAVAFDRNTGELGASFYCSLEPPMDAISKCIVTDQSTAEWWERQSPEAKAALNLNRFGYAQALDKLLVFMRQFNQNTVKVWANDPSFDCAIISHSLAAHNLKTPWRFYNERSYRTVKDLGEDLSNIDYKALDIINATKHNALEDAMYQAKVLCHTYKILKDRIL